MLPTRTFGNDELAAVPAGTAASLSIVIIVSAPLQGEAAAAVGPGLVSEDLPKALGPVLRRLKSDGV
jgi:hypothetical protein